MKVPFSMIMDQAKSEINMLVHNIMKNNNITPDIMDYILSGVVEEIRGMKSSYYSDLYVKSISKSEELKDNQEEK